MIRKIGRKFCKLLHYHLPRMFCGVLFRVNHRVYMKCYLRVLRKNGMSITGTPRYIGYHVVFDDLRRISLGDRVVISDDCHLLTHDYSMTTAMIACGKPPASDIAIVRGIKIGNNVFVGKKTIVMPNTTIGNNVIVGAGSVVRGRIDSGSVIMGNPAAVVTTVQELYAKWERTLASNDLRADN